MVAIVPLLRVEGQVGSNDLVDVCAAETTKDRAHETLAP
jgi:hypothetical protein